MKWPTGVEHPGGVHSGLFWRALASSKLAVESRWRFFIARLGIFC